MYVYIYICTFILGEFHLIQGCPSMRMLKKNLTRVSQSQNQNSAWHVQILAPMLKAVLWLVTIVESRDLKDWVLLHTDFAKGLLGGKPYCSAYRIGLATLTVMIPLVARCPFNFMELHVSTCFSWMNYKATLFCVRDSVMVRGVRQEVSTKYVVSQRD